MSSIDWLEEGRLAAAAYPSETDLAELSSRGITVLINLHQRPHDPALLARYGLNEIHLPVPDMTPPKPQQLDAGVAAIEEALAADRRVAVHCAAGLGRTGTLLACYLVHGGLRSDDAIARVRAARPGTLETPGQVAAVRAYGRRLRTRRTAALEKTAGILDPATYPQWETPDQVSEWVRTQRAAEDQHRADRLADRG